MKKHTLTMLMLILALFLVVGCGGNNDTEPVVNDEEEPVEDVNGNDEEVAEPDEEPEPVDDPGIIASSEQIVREDAVQEKLNIREGIGLDEIEAFLADYASQLKDEYPDHSIMVEAYQDGELVAEIELE